MLTLETVEVHTAGEPFRIVISGLPEAQGDSIAERRTWFRQYADDIRQALIFEPRGHADMYGGYLTQAVSPGADIGIIFIHNEGYSDLCGHGIIALATAAVELGWVERTLPETRVGIDAPCGVIEAFVNWDGNHANGVRFINAPSFIYHRDVKVSTPTFGDVIGDIVYGGVFYFYTRGKSHGLPIRESSIDALTQFGAEVTHAANTNFLVKHPDSAEEGVIYGTVIDGEPRHAGSSQANCCIFADREVDRSPTGTGTAGRVAQLFLRGELQRDEILVNESIIGSVFRGRVIGETTVGDFPAIIPEISGNAYLYGFCKWLFDPRDPFRNGFLVK
jgi:proline racemase